MAKKKPVNKQTTRENQQESSPNKQKRLSLMTALQKLIQEREGTQAEIAATLGITQPRLNDLLKNRIDKFSMDALVTLASKAGLRVGVNTNPIWMEKISPNLVRVRPTFAPEPNQLGQLDATDGTYLLLSLLRCEAIANGLSPKDVVLSLSLNIKDGGIDAKVEQSPRMSGLLSKGLTSYQIKTGASFKPWQPSSLKKTLFGKTDATPSKQLLGDEIQHCLDQNGTYVVVTFGHDLNPDQHTKTTMHLVELLSACGYSDPKIAVYGQGQLVGELDKYPSICLELRRLDGDGCLPIEGWKNYAQMHDDLELGEEQKQFIKEIQNSLEGSTIQHIRIIGDPGIGKTRLVLEAVSDDNIAPSVLYVPSGVDFQKSKLFNELLKPEFPRSVTLVVDDCDEHDRSSIWTALKGRNGIKLVTIDHGPDETHDSSMETYYCPRLQDDQVKSILFKNYCPQSDLSNWAEWCSGSPRVAHAVGENLRSNPDDILKSPADVPLWDRFIIGHKDMDSRDAEQHRIVLRHIALFQRFGFEYPVNEEARFIFREVNQIDPTISWARFQTIVRYYRNKRVLQGRHTLFIVPKALHIYLWVDFWNEYGPGFDFRAFLEGLPESMRDWFLSLFIYAHSSVPAQNVVKDILSIEGPFDNHNFLVSEVGLRFIRYLSEADPHRTIALLERTIKTWSHKDLLAWKTGRQDIVWALEKIAVWEDLYIRAVSILIPMALAENAQNSNNAKGLLCSLFSIGRGWAPTEAPPSLRYPILQELVVSNDTRTRDLGLELCKQWLETRGGGIRVIGAEYQGLKPTVKFWRPKTYGEIYDEWRRVLRLLCKEMKGFSVNDKNKVVEALAYAANGFVRHEQMANEVLDILFELAEDKEINPRPLTRLVIMQRRQMDDDLDEKILTRLDELDKRLTGTSIWDRTKRYVLDTNWDEDYRTRDGKYQELDLPSRRVHELAKQYIQNKSVFSEYVPKLLRENGHRLHEFGVECGKLTDTQFDDIIMKYIQSDYRDVNGIYLGGYLAGIRTWDEGRWDTLLGKLLHVDSTIDIAVQCIWSSGFTEAFVRDMLSLYQVKKITATAFHRIAFRRDKDNLSDGLFQQVINTLLEQGDDESINISTEMVQEFYFNKDRNNNPPPSIFPEDLVFKVLTAKTTDNNHNQMYGYYWDVIARKFLNQHPDRKIELFENMMIDAGRISRHGTTKYIAEIADEIVEEYPDETWKITSELMVSDTKNFYELIFWLGDRGGFDDEKIHGPINKMPALDIIKWIKEDVENRLWLIREVLPKTLNEDEGGTLTRLFIEEFCDDESIANGVSVHFHMGGSTGPESIYLSQKRDAARLWLSEIHSPKIQVWLGKYIDYLNNRIEQCQIREEREF